MIVGSNLCAQGTTAEATLQKFMVYPGLEFGEVDGRQVVKASLKSTLHLILEFNTSLQSLLLGEQIALSALEAAGNRNNPVWKNDFRVNKTVRGSSRTTTENASSTPQNSSSTATYNANESHTFSSSWSKKGGNGIRYSATFSESTSKTRTYRKQENKKNKIEEQGVSDPSVSSSLKLGVSVPILQDWGAINDLPVLRSRLSVDNSQFNTQKSRLETLEIIARSYWDLAGLWKTREVLLESAKLSEQLLEENRIRTEAGVLMPTDVKESEIQLFRNQQQLLKNEHDIRNIEDQMKVALNLVELPYGLFPSDTPQLHPIDFQFKQQLQKVLQNSSDLKLLNSKVKNNQYDLDDAYNQDKTNLDLNLDYTFSGNDKEFSKTLETYDESKLQGYQIGLTWEVPLFDYKTPEQIKQKKLERTQLDIQLVNTKDDLTMKLKTIQRNLRFAAQEIENATVIRQLAEEVLQQEIAKQRLGQSTGFRVSQAQQELVSAQSSEIQSLINYEKVYLSLLVLTGDIYEHFEIPR